MTVLRGLGYIVKTLQWVGERLRDHGHTLSDEAGPALHRLAAFPAFRHYLDWIADHLADRAHASHEGFVRGRSSCKPLRPAAYSCLLAFLHLPGDLCLAQPPDPG